MAERPAKGLKIVRDIRQFFHEVSTEMKKVSWPSRTEVVNTTIVVIIAVFFFAFYLFGTDILLAYVIEGIEWASRKVFG
jgi:preprotein translocase subunit SecE